MDGLLLKTVIKNAVKESFNAEKLKKINEKKDALMRQVDKLVALKKQTYKNIDISSPMSKEEKDLDKEIANLYSEINQLIMEKRRIV